MMKNKIAGFFFILNTISYSITYAEADLPVNTNSIAKDHDGFVIEWENGSMSDFLSQVNNLFDTSFDSVDLFGMLGSSESSNIKAHDYHRQDTQDANNSADLARADTQVDTAEQSKPDSASESQEEPDWRYERKWWQRGTTPIL